MKRKIIFLIITIIIFASIMVVSISTINAGVEPTSAEKAVLLLDNLNISQGMNGSFSHKGSFAIDICGKDKGIESIKTFFTGTIKKIDTSNSSVYFQSKDKVQYADGTYDYMTVQTLHDNNIKDLYVGKEIKQGQVYYQEGDVGKATGNHIHLAVGKGKFVEPAGCKNKYGTWCIANEYPINDALFLSSSAKKINDYGYKWRKYTYSNPIPKKYPEPTKKVVQAPKATSVTKVTNTTTPNNPQSTNKQKKPQSTINPNSPSKPQSTINPNNQNNVQNNIKSTNPNSAQNTDNAASPNNSQNVISLDNVQKEEPNEVDDIFAGLNDFINDFINDLINIL